MHKMGIIGFGGLGQMLAGGFEGKYEVSYYDPKIHLDDYYRYDTIEALVANTNTILVVVPFDSFDSVIDELCRLELGGKLIVDMLSTKTLAMQKYKKLPDWTDILSLHPLFGPPSFTKFQPGMRIVSCYKKGQLAEKFEQELKEHYKFQIITVSPEEHDRHMAYHHAIPFILAHSLSKTDFNKDPGDLTIPSEEKLRRIVDIAGNESEDLYLTILRSNPYAKVATEDLLKTLLSEYKRLWH